MPVHHDAFISYSHTADGALAPAFQRGLEQLAKPLLRLRAQKIFRDQTDLTASPALWPGIVSHLAASDWLLVFANPLYAGSRWCRKEVEWWLAERSPERLLIVLTDGDIVWDEARRDFDWTRTTALPDCLAGHLADEPLYVDLRWARETPGLSLAHGGFREAVVRVAAPLRGVSPTDLDGADLRQLRRTRLFVRSGVGAICVAAGMAVWQARVATEEARIAETQRQQAEAQRRIAESERAQAEAQRHIAEAERARAEAQRHIAESERARAEAALAASERELLRAQSAELRALRARLDTLIADAITPGHLTEIAPMQAERALLDQRLADVTRQYLARLAEQIGYRGGFEFLMKWEGNAGRVALIGSSVFIDPLTDLALAKPDDLRRRYEFLLTPAELQALIATAGKRGAEAQAAYAAAPILARIRIRAEDVARLVPDVIEPFWKHLRDKHPILRRPDTPPAVHTALLSVAVNLGARVESLAPFIDAGRWRELADAIDALAARPPVLAGLKRRRAEEAALIRAALAGQPP